MIFKPHSETENANFFTGRAENGSPDLLVMHPSMSQHAGLVMDLMNRQRSDPSLCDYEIRVCERSFYCHKCILIGLSDFFKVMLTGSMKESKENFVQLKVSDKTKLETNCEKEFFIFLKDLTLIRLRDFFVQIHPIVLRRVFDRSFVKFNFQKK